jgi:hypothetical protein
MLRYLLWVDIYLFIRSSNLNLYLYIALVCYTCLKSIGLNEGVYGVKCYKLSTNYVVPF